MLTSAETPLVLEQAIFLVDISINVGITAISIEDRDRKITIPVFKQLPSLRNQLMYRRSSIQQKLMRFSRPYWFLAAPDLPVFRDELLELLVFAEQLREEVLASYNQEHQSFLAELRQIGAETHAERFPSRKEAACNLISIALHGPLLPSCFADTSSLSEAQQQAFSELQTYWFNSIYNSLAIATDRTQEDSERLIVELSTISEVTRKSGRLHSSTRKRLAKQMQQLSSAVNFLTATSPNAGKRLGKQMEQLRKSIGE